jgi:hypothetical protein
VCQEATDERQEATRCVSGSHQQHVGPLGQESAFLQVPTTVAEHLLPRPFDDINFWSTTPSCAKTPMKSSRFPRFPEPLSRLACSSRENGPHLDTHHRRNTTTKFCKQGMDRLVPSTPRLVPVATSTRSGPREKVLICLSGSQPWCPIYDYPWTQRSRSLEVLR